MMYISSNRNFSQNVNANMRKDDDVSAESRYLPLKTSTA